MSDFDREAERERLREQYEQDRQEREATERMSELLLQGATMTNAHCSDCGDPIFRYDGQEFCATCEKAVDRGTDSGSEDAAEADGDDDGQGAPEQPRNGEHIEVTSPDEGTGVQFGDAAQSDGATAGTDAAGAEPDADESRDDDRPDQGPAGTPGESAPSRRLSPDPEDPEPERLSDRSPRRARPPTDAPADTPGEAEAGAGADVGAGARDDLAGARASLKRTLARLSRQAEAAEDPAAAREYLAAAREAAQTLAALRYPS